MSFWLRVPVAAGAASAGEVELVAGEVLGGKRGGDGEVLALTVRRRH